MVISSKVPVVEIVTATKSTYIFLDSGDSHELRVELVQLLDRPDKVKDKNVTKEDWEPIDKLKNNDTIVIRVL